MATLDQEKALDKELICGLAHYGMGSAFILFDNNTLWMGRHLRNTFKSIAELDYEDTIQTWCMKINPLVIKASDDKLHAYAILIYYISPKEAEEKESFILNLISRRFGTSVLPSNISVIFKALDHEHVDYARYLLAGYADYTFIE